MKTNGQVLLKQTYLLMFSVIRWPEKNKQYHISWWQKVNKHTLEWMDQEYK